MNSHVHLLNWPQTPSSSTPGLSSMSHVPRAVTSSMRAKRHAVSLSFVWRLLRPLVCLKQSLRHWGSAMAWPWPRRTWDLISQSHQHSSWQTIVRAYLWWKTSGGRVRSHGPAICCDITTHTCPPVVSPHLGSFSSLGLISPRESTMGRRWRARMASPPKKATTETWPDELTNPKSWRRSTSCWLGWGVRLRSNVWSSENW